MCGLKPAPAQRQDLKQIPPQKRDGITKNKDFWRVYFEEEMPGIFKGTQFEFRNRYLIHLAIFLAGFMVPWDRILHMQNGFLTWGVLAIYPQEHGWMPIVTSTLVVTALGLFFAAAGAFLRTWGTAYLGAEVVKDSAMHGGAVVADGPYRHVRNPL
jgi:hypothetical protein